MQFFTLIGGFIGFLLTLAVSLLAGKSLEICILNATIGCVIVGFLFRGLHYAVEHCAKQIVAEKTRIRDEQLAAEQAAAATTEGSQPSEPGSEPAPATAQPAT
jgi:uncharacterized membrane protein YjfL (UPF0719 family)